MINAYYILKDNEQTGPFTHEELFENGIEPDTLVLSPIAEDWQHAADLPELQTWFERTGIYVPSPVNLANFWWRLLAYLIDYVLLIVFMTLLGVVMGLIIALSDNSSFDFESTESDMFFRLTSVVILIFYNAALEATKLQGSIGKTICKLVVVNIHGKRLTFANSLGRNAGKIISSLLCGIGFLNIFWSNMQQGWHDQMANTYVVRRND